MSKWESIQFAELAKCYYGYARRGFERLSPVMQGAIERGNAIPARDYIAALDWADILNTGLDEIFERCVAISTSAAPGPAPAFADGTGHPIFNGLWTLCRTPTVRVPLFETEAGLPMRAQLVGRRGDDGRLLRTARWLSSFVAACNSEA